MNRGWHGLHCRENLLGKETQALFGLGPGHPPVEHVHDQHFEADGPLHGVNFVDNLLGRPDGLGGTARGEARIGHANIGGLAFQVLLIDLLYLPA